MAKGSVETKINWTKDVDTFEKRLATGQLTRGSKMRKSPTFMS